MRDKSSQDVYQYFKISICGKDSFHSNELTLRGLLLYFS